MSTNIRQVAAEEFFSSAKCTACGFDPEEVDEHDLPARLRAVPTEWRRTLSLRLDDPYPDQLLTGRQFAGAWSALEHAGHVRDVLHALDIRIQRVLREDRPVLPETHTTPPAGANEQGPPIVLAALNVSAEQLAQTVEAVPETAWSRLGRRGGREVTALDLAQEALHEGIHHLREAAQVIEELRLSETVR
ncbi:MAG TPA: DinB family protein [Acidimicrobiales bacterium]|nr:DinB family protein [Acidimicrobiales bacterium]